MATSSSAAAVAAATDDVQRARQYLRRAEDESNQLLLQLEWDNPRRAMANALVLDARANLAVALATETLAMARESLKEADARGDPAAALARKRERVVDREKALEARHEEAAESRKNVSQLQLQLQSQFKVNAARETCQHKESQ